MYLISATCDSVVQKLHAAPLLIQFNLQSLNSVL